MRVLRLALALTLLEICSGCTASQLRQNTVAQVATVSDIYETQVLNNLAEFVYNPGSLPHFSLATQGNTQILNTTAGQITPGFGIPTVGPHMGHVAFNGLGLQGSGSHQASDAFILVPVNDPRKLELMRCAYQRAVSKCCAGKMSTTCPDCQTRFKMFYTGDADGDIASKSKGIVTSECLGKDCWFHTGCKKCLPKHGNCVLTGNYCDVYVWVTAEGRDELSKLTLTILDYAQNPFPTGLTKQVVYYVDEHGIPTTAAESVGTVTAIVGIDERIESVLHTNKDAESTLEQTLRSQREVIEQQIRKVEADSRNDIAHREETRERLKMLLAQKKVLDSKLEFLRQEIEAGQLQNRFVPGGAAPVPTFFPTFQLNTLLNQTIRNTGP